MAARIGSAAMLALATATTVLAVAAPGCAEWRDPVRRVGAVVEDATIADTVRARLVSTRDLDSTGIEVRVIGGGGVVLAGTSGTALAKSTAEAIAVKVPGVTSVRNEVSVRP